MQETSYRALHLLGQQDEVRRAGVLVRVNELPVQNPQVAIENLLDGRVPVWEARARGQKGQSGLGSRRGRSPVTRIRGGSGSAVPPLPRAFLDLERARVSNAGERSFSPWMRSRGIALHAITHQSHSHLKCQTRRPVTRETSRRTTMVTATTTRRFGPRFSTFLEFMAGRNSTPSSRLFMSWEGERRQDGGKAVPKAGFGEVQPPSSREQSLGVGSTATLKASALLFHAYLTPFWT